LPVLRLRKPPYPAVDATARLYWIQTQHRRTAIEFIVGAIDECADRELAVADDALSTEMTETMRAWGIETLVQGAWMREYHVWEKDTKEYVREQHARNGSTVPKAKTRTHVNWVLFQLSLFDARVPEAVIAVINAARDRLNAVKHDAGVLLEHFVTLDDLEALMKAVEEFWEPLAGQEEFTPPARR
jgi:hypothetical protein